MTHSLKKKMSENNLYKEESRVANILLHGTPAAKCEIIVQLVYLGNETILAKVLNAMSDVEYRRVMPTA